MSIKFDDNGHISGKAFKLNHRDKFMKWLAENDGLWFSVTFKVIGKSKDRKSLAQLGLWFGFFVPIVTEELIAQGHTLTIDCYGIHREMPVDEGYSHELLTQLCCRFENNEVIRLSDERMDVGRMSRAIENVIVFCVDHLRMDEKKLREKAGKSKRPK